MIIPRFDRAHRASTFSDDDIGALRDDRAIAAETRASFLSKRLVSDPLLTLLRSGGSVKFLFAAMPSVSLRFFYGSSFFSLGLLFLSPVISQALQNLADDFLNITSNPFWIRYPLAGWFVDPMVMHGLVFLFVAWLWYSVLWRKKGGAWDFVFLSVLLLAVAALSYLLFNELWKPVLGLPRPPNYDFSREPPLARFFVSRWGSLEGAPSGFAARQALLFLVLLWATFHPVVTLGVKKSLIALVRVVGLLSLIAVGLERYLVGAHDVSDIVLGFALAVPSFWTVMLPMFVLFVPGGGANLEKRMLSDLAAMWILIGVALAFYAKQPFYPILLSLGLSAFLTLSRGIRALLPSVNLLSFVTVAEILGFPSKVVGPSFSLAALRGLRGQSIHRRRRR